MKKLLFILLFIPLLITAQKVDTVIVTPIYTSYFSYTTHTPLYVRYKLFHGGGTSSRQGLTFKTGELYQSATEQDYKGNGYDIGHMTNAEDFAYDPKKEEMTFRFYNALPQLPKLNRGVWKVFETNIRKQSQTDSILIICGGYNFTKKMNNRIGIPDMCFKIYKDLKTKETHYLIFPNDNSDSYKEITPQQFLVLTKYNIKL